MEHLDFSTIKTVFSQVLDRASALLAKEKNHLVILIDGIEQLGLAHGAHLLDWVPQTTSTNCTLILSCTLPTDENSVPGHKLSATQHTRTNAAYYSSLSRRTPQLHCVLVVPLGFKEADAIQKICLREHSKHLNDTQTRLLLNKHDSTKPLYLMTACEELRIQGQYGGDGMGIDDMIRSFPNDLLSMFNFLLERLEKDMHQFCVEIGHTTPGRIVVQVRVFIFVVVVENVNFENHFGVLFHHSFSSL